MKTAQEKRKPKRHSCAVSSIAISLDGKNIVSGSDDNTIL